MRTSPHPHAGSSSGLPAAHPHLAALLEKLNAAIFVASQGDIRGSHLEAALRHIRGKLPSLAANDMQLAQAILTI